MSGERVPLPPGRGRGLSRGCRSMSYGSLIRSPLTSVHRFIEHTVQPGETLQGLAVKYGVSMEQIKRANRLYTNDSIFLKKSLSIPVPSDLDDFRNAVTLSGEGNTDSASLLNGHTENVSEKKQKDGREKTADPTPVEFLKKLDDLISQSKQAATRGCLGSEKRVAALEAACCSETSGQRPLARSQSVVSSSRFQQPAGHIAVPLTITKLTKLKDREDEIFEL
ncbi:lysM and putative peptidoglycan-binding domain-containing protein 1 [Austrofundulus limnaeus]|uniref:LysM and putative peptidoglycan-binding domain-containing protein 1 n=1 Tax=Austrofundulus limnaeus TaxID=52670 RepID=A0A2I4BZN2_AUSLI|nr:PREDICTED: lysM and putative peptidoglycan-binding domain-containing protein 1 [Austrofundulus limnaeus]